HRVERGRNGLSRAGMSAALSVHERRQARHLEGDRMKHLRAAVIGLVGLVGAACGGGPPDDGTAQTESAIGTCGPKPTTPLCYVLVCDSDGTWSPEPASAGTVCKTTGHCDGAGHCVMPSPKPINPPPSGLSVYAANAHEIILQFTCGANAD